MAARRLDRLNELKAELETQYGVQVTAAELDLADIASGDAFYEKLPADLRDNVDVLVNNAGVGAMPRPVHLTDFADLDTVINTNVKGVVKMIKLFVPGMLKRQTGHIINVSSTVGKDSAPNIGIYAGSKHMLEAINTSLRAELVATPLRVSMVSPGITESDFFVTAHKDTKGAVFNQFIPLRPADLADAITFVASRPPHVQVVDLFTVSVSQASLHVLARGGAVSAPAHTQNNNDVPADASKAE